MTKTPSDEALALAATQARYGAAQTNILTAILAVLMRHRILTAEQVESEILNETRDVFLPLAEAESEDPCDEALEARATLRLNARIRSVLFGVHEA